MSSECKLRLPRSGGFVLEAQVDLPSEGVLGLFGHSGCGKTTLIRCLAGLEPSACGKIVFNDNVWLDSEKKIFVPAHKRAIGYVFQDAALFDHLTVYDNLMYGYNRAGGRKHIAEFDHVTGLTGVTPLLKRTTINLSGGERQRVAMARALMSAPQLLLYDEPLASLDQSSRQAMMRLLERIKRAWKIPAVYISHSAEELAALADTVTLMDNGKTTTTGNVFQILTRPDTPYAKSDNALFAIPATVEKYDEEHHLATLSWLGGQMLLPRHAKPEIENVRIVAHARDVSLTEEMPKASSILNIFPVTVTGRFPAGEAFELIQLAAGEAPILSRITKYSADRLDIHPGKKLFAQLKTASLANATVDPSPSVTAQHNQPLSE